ncbi:hypothetical protein [Jiangella rhizosphaerae]|uniref:Uncharacterized protein n=1 Tax=Jiangella rhizosphaerae TaxID=2293569 RepID=A0A418KI41_9ACTN|nr:hypothetical protein [Jiangella rhizosphaerae]RIQ12214.1 hypothetical protein DY240_27360 [Jiangella rhizosphaerae]
MSAIELMSVAAEVAPSVQVVADGGVFGWVESEAGQLESTMQTLSIVVAVVFVVFRAVKTGFAIASIAIAALMAGVFVWVVHNVDILGNRVDQEINSAPAAVVQVDVGAVER